MQPKLFNQAMNWKRVSMFSENSNAFTQSGKVSLLKWQNRWKSRLSNSQTLFDSNTAFPLNLVWTVTVAPQIMKLNFIRNLFTWASLIIKEKKMECEENEKLTSFSWRGEIFFNFWLFLCRFWIVTHGVVFSDRVNNLRKGISKQETNIGNKRRKRIKNHFPHGIQTVCERRKICSKAWS